MPRCSNTGQLLKGGVVEKRLRTIGLKELQTFTQQHVVRLKNL